MRTVVNGMMVATVFALNANVSEGNVLERWTYSEAMEAYALGVRARWNTGNPVIHPHLLSETSIPKHTYDARWSKSTKDDV